MRGNLKNLDTKDILKWFSISYFYCKMKHGWLYKLCQASSKLLLLQKDYSERGIYSFTRFFLFIHQFIDFLSILFNIYLLYFLYLFIFCIYIIQLFSDERITHFSQSSVTKITKIACEVPFILDSFDKQKILFSW